MDLGSDLGNLPIDINAPRIRQDKYNRVPLAPWPRPRFLDRFCYTRLRRKIMKLRSESYPDRIRRIAQEVSQLRNLYQVDHSVEKLRMIANELEQVLKKTPLKKA